MAIDSLLFALAATDDTTPEKESIWSLSFEPHLPQYLEFVGLPVNLQFGHIMIQSVLYKYLLVPQTVQ